MLAFSCDRGVAFVHLLICWYNPTSVVSNYCPSITFPPLLPVVVSLKAPLGSVLTSYLSSQQTGSGRNTYGVESWLLPLRLQRSARGQSHQSGAELTRGHGEVGGVTDLI